MGFSFLPNVVHILGLLGFAKIEIIHDLTRNITYVNLADLGVEGSVWTSALQPVDPMLVNKLF